MLEMPCSLDAGVLYQNGQEIANLLTKHSKQPDISPDGWKSLSCVDRMVGAGCKGSPERYLHRVKSMK
jgi:hypothetical protein